MTLLVFKTLTGSFLFSGWTIKRFTKLKIGSNKKTTSSVHLLPFDWMLQKSAEPLFFLLVIKNIFTPQKRLNCVSNIL
jgi:hypothetical protein